MIICPVVLAGGFGKRLYPLSTMEKPKQFINFFKDNTSFFQHNIKRIREVLKIETIIITCNKLNLELVKLQLIQLNEKNYRIIVEEDSKNTFCSLLTILKLIEIENKKVDTIFISTADSYIENTKEFVKNLKMSFVVSFFTQKNLIFGIQPSEANTNYGYIKTNKNKFDIFDDGFFLNVDSFLEKPDKKTAEKFIKNKNYLWNSGNFIFNYKTLIKEIKQYQLKNFITYKKMNLLQKSKNIFYTNDVFLTLDNLQIDKAIIEKSKNLICCKADFDWCDIGSFEVIERLVIAKKIVIPNINHLCLTFNKNLLKTKSTL